MAETLLQARVLRAVTILISPICLIVYGLLFFPNIVYQAARVNLWTAFGWRLPPEGDPVELLADD